MGIVRLLMLEDSTLDYELEVACLKRAGFNCDVRRVETRDAFSEAVRSPEIEVILADFSLPDFDGISALEIAKEERPELPFIFVSGVMGEEVAINCLHSGATDYVLKQRLERLPPALKRALKESEDRRERKRAEDERNRLLLSERAARAEAEQKAEQLRKSNEELEQYAYAASHDLREPLRTIRLYTQMLIRKYRDKLDGDAEQYINYVESNVERMEHLIRDLLAYSQVTHGELDRRPSVDTGDVVRNVISSLGDAIEKAHAKVELDHMPVVNADPQRLGQVFQNLLSNSIKYVDGVPPKIKIGARKDEKDWVFTVKDNGIGFDPRYAGRIFGLFRRLHREEYEGTGVGLAVCKRIVEEHGGRIWAESEPGKGATFSFTLPVTDQAKTMLA